MNISEREASLKRFEDTIKNVSGTKNEQISVRIQELAKYLDRERKYVEARSKTTDSRELKRINKNIKKAVKQFNVNLSQLLGTGKPLTHDAWRAANRIFPELSNISALIEAHHGLGVEVTASGVLQFTAPQWAEYDERLGEGLIQRGITLTPGNTDPNVVGIFKPFHQAGVHSMDVQLRPEVGKTVEETAENMLRYAEQQQSLTGLYSKTPEGKIVINPEAVSIGAPANAVLLEGISRDPTVATQMDIATRSKDPELFTEVGVRKLASDVGLPESMLVEEALPPNLQKLRFKGGSAVLQALPLVGLGAAVVTAGGQAMAGERKAAAATLAEAAVGEVPVVGDVLQSEPVAGGTFEDVQRRTQEGIRAKQLQRRAAQARQRGGKLKVGFGGVKFALPEFGLSELMGIN